MSRRALLVEDDVATGSLLADNLRAWGFEPAVLHEGKPAVAWARRHLPDLILLDLMLPDVDGYEVCKELKLGPDTNRIPVILVTARSQFEDRVHGLEVGANYYLAKPFTAEQFRAAVDQACAWRDQLERHGTEGEVHFQLRSAPRYLEELNQLLAALFRFTGLSPGQARHLTLAVRELGANAIEWGHQNQPDRIVTVTYRIDAAKVSIVVRDTGPGFDPNNMPHAARPHDPAGHVAVRETLGIREGGLGILMVRGLVDELHYNDKGNEVRLVKYFAPRA
jgi:CheY-like chemotaxis protein/anti-sigma regulatory factor (Ser/Thr protein kinase)